MKQSIQVRASAMLWVVTPIILIGLFVATYWTSLVYTFQFDDEPNILKSCDMLSGSMYGLLFTGTRWLGHCLNVLNFNIGGFNSRYFRLTNLAIHAISGLSVYVMCAVGFSHNRQKLIAQHSWLLSTLVAGLFLLHPVQTQTVSYIVQGRLEGLAGMLILLMAASFVVMVQQYPRIIRGIAGMTLFVCAVLVPGAKGIGIIAPLIVLLVDWFLIAQGSWRSLSSRWHIHAVVTSIVGAVFGYLSTAAMWAGLFVQKSHQGSSITPTSGTYISPILYLFSTFKVVLHYALIFVWPFNICCDYDWQLVGSFFDLDALLPCAVLVVFGFLLARHLRKTPESLVGFGALWFLVCVLPRTSIFPVQDFVVDYKTYTASLGVLFLIALLLVCLVARLNARASYATQGTLAVLLLVPVSFATYHRNKVWSSSEMFWADVLAKCPGKPRAYNYFGIALINQHRHAQAVAYLKKAISMDQEFVDPYCNLAVCYSALGDLDQAVDVVKRALNVNPYRQEGWCNLGLYLLRQKKYDDAKLALDQAVKLSPQSGPAHLYMAMLHEAQGNLEAAWKSYKTCCTQSTYHAHPKALSQFAQLSVELGKYSDAITTYLKMEKFMPGVSSVQYNLACAYLLNKQFDQAQHWYARVVQSNPNDGYAWCNLGESYLRADNASQALAAFESAHKLIGDEPALLAKIDECRQLVQS